MRQNVWTKTAIGFGTAMVTALVLAQPAAAAGGGPGAAAGPGPGAGRGMMRSDGGGPGRGDCSGYDGGYGYGAGMMRGDGAGPGWGGPGMMRGHGAGPGWGRGSWGALGELGLSADQEQKIAAVREDMRRKTWETMGELRGEQFKLHSLFRADKPDPDAIAAQQKRVDDLRLTMVKAHVEAGNQMRAVLTTEQRERLREYRSRWWDDGDED